MKADFNEPLDANLHCLLRFFFNLLYTGRLFYYYMLDKSICHFRGVRSILLLLLYFELKMLANNVDPDQMPHYMASDLGLHCLSMTHLWVSM